MAILNEGANWFGHSACKPVFDAGDDLWFHEGPGPFPAWQSLEAKIVCNSCPVRVNCLAYATERELGYVMEERPKNKDEEQIVQPDGIWGGLLPDQRVKLAKRLTGMTPAQRARAYRQVGSTPIRFSDRAMRDRAARRRAARRNAA